VSTPNGSSEAIGATNHATLNIRPALPVLLDDPPVQHNDQLPEWVDDEQLVNLYYLNFHTAHPVLLPKSLYWKRRYPRFLKAVVEFIGSHFSPAVSSDTLRRATAREIESGDQNNPEMVQARVLYTIAIFARNEVDEGHQMLAQAAQIAIELRMHQRGFAASYANNQPMEEESMRRTWYELYVVDGCVAAFQRKSFFETNSVGADVLLPCDDDLYNDDKTFPHITASRTDFESSVFANEEMTFSSFCYRIEAVRLLGRVLAITGAHGVHRDRVQAVDNALAAFIHHLPPSKSEPEIVNTYGELDELMFQTHMIIQYATMLLHFPRSDLASPILSSTAVLGGNSAKLVCPCNRQQMHSIKAIDASKTLSMLAAFRYPVQGHSPFFVYTLALGAVVQLAVSANHSKSSGWCLEQHYDRVKLMLGVLKSFSQHWRIAEVVLRVLNKMALAVFHPPREEDPGLAHQHDATDSVIDSCSYGPPIIDNQWLDNFDMQDIQDLIGLDTNGFCL
jgi:hypothetical protein